MMKNKKFPVVALLLTVYALLLFHEVVLNHVLCFKNDGTTEFELAFFDLNCQCKEKNDHSPYTEPGESIRIFPQSDDCYDLPVGNSWLNRNTNAGAISVDVNRVRQYNLNLQAKLQLKTPFGRLPEAVPLSKFTGKNPPLTDSVVLRC